MLLFHMHADFFFEIDLVVPSSRYQGRVGSRDEKVDKHRIEQIIVSNSSLVSGLSEASGVKSSWVEVSQEGLTKNY